MVGNILEDKKRGQCKEFPVFACGQNKKQRSKKMDKKKKRKRYVFDRRLQLLAVDGRRDAG